MRWRAINRLFQRRMATVVLLVADESWILIHNVVIDPADRHLAHLDLRLLALHSRGWYLVDQSTATGR